MDEGTLGKMKRIKMHAKLDVIFEGLVHGVGI